MELKKEFLRLLEEDVEFRYAVASYLGLLEILKRMDRLEEGQNRLWEEVRALREGQNKLWEEVRSLRIEVESFGKAVGRTLEDYTSAFVELLLKEKGYPKESIEVGRKTFIYEGKLMEIDVFNEEPLIVREVTTYIDNVAQAREEMDRLLKRVNAVEKMFGRKVEVSLFSVTNAPHEVLSTLKEIAKEHGVKLIYGRELIE